MVACGDQLTSDLEAGIAALPIYDTHSHIDPFAPTAKSLTDVLGYHYYTELAHSAGMEKKDLAAEPREQCRAILRYFDRFDNTAQSQWLLHIAQSYLNF